jgi:ATP-dependent DNA helicase RecQ
VNTGTILEIFEPDEDLTKYIGEKYYQIRNTGDTHRAIYRLNVLGIIDDYVVDYAGKFFKIKFKAKSEEEYLSNLRSYIRRYLGLNTTQNWINKVGEIEGESILEKVLYVLIEFIEREISHKRKLSIDYMKELCGVFLTEGELEFRDRMVRYFTSKYARSDYLPRDTENGRKENCSIVKSISIIYLILPMDWEDRLTMQSI